MIKGIHGLFYSSQPEELRAFIRMALGAQRERVIALVLKGAGRLILIGIAVGLPVAWAASRWLESMFGLKRSDPSAIGGAIGLLVTAALVAAYLPALRASRVDPMAALRHECGRNEDRLRRDHGSSEAMNASEPGCPAAIFARPPVP
jgi:predicted lysophospholipase L1 biosynthesis ABC-type transport system permease subunit